MIEITFIPEFKITKKDSLSCNNLIQESFSKLDFKGRDYFKQPPHYRILVKENNKLIG